MNTNYLISFLKDFNIALCMISLAITVQAQATKNDTDFAETEVYVKLRPKAIRFMPNATSSSVNVANELPSLQNTIQKYKYSQTLRPFYFSKTEKLQQVYRIKITDATLINKFIAELNQNPDVEYAERVPVMKTQQIPALNDPAIDSLWHLNKIQAFEAYNIAQSKTIVPLAVVDEFMQVDHPDLFQNMSYCQDIANGDMDVRPSSEANVHGTHVSGIIGAAANNGIGIVGIGLNRVKIVGLNAAMAYTGSLLYTAECVLRASELRGVRVISMSYGGYAFSQTDSIIYANAHQAGIVLVAAAGNNNSSTVTYPAAYKSVITVASTENHDLRSYFSNFGSLIDIAAPGSDIFSTLPYNKYGRLSGTSMATPLVAGAISFLLSIRPELNADSVEALIKNTADNISSLNPSYALDLGYGRINLKKAVECINSYSTNNHFSILSTSAGNYCNGQSYVLSVPNTVAASTYQWYQDGVLLDGDTGNTLTVGTTATYSVTVTNNNCPRKSQWLKINFTNCE